MHEKVKPNYFKTFILTGLFFGLSMWGFFALLGFSGAGWRGLIAGGLFGAAVTVIVRILMGRSDTEKKEMLGDMPVILSGGANHLKPFESVGGWLYLTNDALHFKSHGMNVQDHETSIPLTEIRSVEVFNMFGLVPNGLRLVMSNGQESFVVNSRKRWLIEISSRISK